MVLCPYPYKEAAGQRLKYEQYFDSWENAGYQIELSPYMGQSLWKVLYKKGYYLTKILGVIRGYIIRLLDLTRIYKYDIVYIHQWITPFGTTLIDRIVRKLAHKIVYDLEDFVIIQEQLNESINPILKYIRSQGKIQYLIAKSDHVITSSPKLNEYCIINNIYSSATFISSSVDTNKFIPVNKYENNGEVVIGWTGTFSSIRYLNLLKDVFIDLNKTADFKLRIIGNFEYDIPGVDLEVIQWTKEKEVEDLQGIDIGVYPLETNNWVLGKSGLKAIQYMAFGIPTVATAIGTSKEIINHMNNGLLVETKEDWIDALKTLITNPELRKSLGIEARKTIIERYSLKAIDSQYLDIINNL